MNVVFMGTPEFAIPSLKAIAASGHKLSAVVTGEDAPKGRGLKLQEPPVKRVSKELGIKIIQPSSLISPDFIESLKTLSPDIFVVVAFKILPDEVIRIPKFGSINLHPSLLPKYRGAAPINWAIINGEKETGVTVFIIKQKVDAGDILLQKRVNIGDDETAGSLSEKLAGIGAGLIVEALDRIESGKIEPTSQDDALATNAPKIKPETCRIDWSKSALEIKHLIHGLSPKPGAFTFFNNRRIKILRAEVGVGSSGLESGSIVMKNRAGLGVQTGDGLLFPKEIQIEGKRPLNIENFIRGFRCEVGERFG